VHVVHARGSGDDEIVAQASRPGDTVVVVTADRMLQARVTSVGATSLSPSWLLDHL
jgi:rRNA-processing protein FCF1